MHAGRTMVIWLMALTAELTAVLDGTGVHCRVRLMTGGQGERLSSHGELAGHDGGKNKQP